MAVHTDQQADLRKEQKRQGELIRIKEYYKTEAVKALYASPAGRAYLLWLLEVGRAIGQQPFRGKATHTAFACGELNVGNQIMAHMVQSDPTAFAELLKEKADVDSRERERARNLEPDLFDSPDESDEPGGGEPAGESPFYD